eukprot:1160721-Pelagomonas_calceolata.AAC.7
MQQTARKRTQPIDVHGRAATCGFWGKDAATTSDCWGELAASVCSSHKQFLHKNCSHQQQVLQECSHWRFGGGLPPAGVQQDESTLLEPSSNAHFSKCMASKAGVVAMRGAREGFLGIQPGPPC